MKDINVNKCMIWLLFLSGIAVTACYPTGKPELTQDPDQRNEKHFPNGTVVGKYAYLDNDGNPIQVKYYADDASYGVELKSIKVVDSTGEPVAAAYSKDYNPMKALIPHIPEAKVMSPDVFSTIDPAPKQRSEDPFDYLNKDMHKLNRYQADKSNPDFEIYYQNELKGPKKCGKEKVRVYFDKERKIRNTLNSFDVDKYCEQF